MLNVYFINGDILTIRNVKVLNRSSDITMTVQTNLGEDYYINLRFVKYTENKPEQDA